MNKKYGLVKGGVVQSVFYSTEPKGAYPDIADYLMEIPEEVGCNWLFLGGSFVPPAVEPSEVELLVAEEKPWWKFWA